MDQQRAVQSVDLWDVRLRASTVRFAVWITIAVCSFAAVYLFASWDKSNRSLILLLSLLSMHHQSPWLCQAFPSSLLSPA